MQVLYIIVLSIASIVELFVLCKLMGYRQLSQMSMFDYVNGITIGNIAAEMATSLDDSFVEPLVAMIVYALAAILLSWWSSKSIRARRIIAGKPTLLLNNGKLFEKNFRKAKIDINEFLAQCRVNGYFDISQLQSAILEENGHISFLPKSSSSPLTPKDMQLMPDTDAPVATLIIDGHIMPGNLKASGKDEKWLKSQLQTYGISNVKDVFLATCDLNQKFTVYPYAKDEIPPDILA